MCLNLQEGEGEYDLDEELLTLYKHFKTEQEREAQEPLNDEDLIVDFIMIIQERIEKVVSEAKEND